MRNMLNITAGLAIGLCAIVPASGAHAQQWYNNTQAVPVAQEPAPETKNWNYTRNIRIVKKQNVVRR